MAQLRGRNDDQGLKVRQMRVRLILYVDDSPFRQTTTISQLYFEEFLMKISFTSCFDVLDDNEQKVWRKVSEQHPDVLLLLGDSIYMDFGIAIMSDHPLGKPRRWGLERFSDEMYRRYKAQSEVNSFRDLVGTVSAIGAIWDDHDFGWNNSAGIGNINSKHVVPQDKKLISRSLHLQFRKWLRAKPTPQAYPEKPSIDEMLRSPDQGIEEDFDIDSVRFLMLDGRYYREDKNTTTPGPIDDPETEHHGSDHDVGTTSLLGGNQRDWLADKINDWPGLSIICSGSTLDGRRSDAWDQYLDFEWLTEQEFNNTIILSGDIHDIKMPKREAFGNIWEFTASGAARPKFGGDSGNFGIINTSNQGNTWNLEVTLYDEDGPAKEKTIALE